MKHEWHVTVRDHEGAAIEDATVAIQPAIFFEALDMEYPFTGAPATHVHDGGGHYLSFTLQMSEGPWFLVVLHADKSPVVQPLDMHLNAKGEFFANPPPTKLAKTVSFAAEMIETDAGESVRKTTFEVAMFPQSEVVLLSGTEYESRGTQFGLFALGRRDALFREGVIDAGTLVTLFACDNRGHGTFVKAHRGFVDVRAMPAPPPGVVPGRAHVALSSDTAKMGKALRDGGAVSIVDFYRYLSRVGKERPGSVKEAGVISHAWEGGPILYDTNDVQEERLTPNGRSGLDFDGRVKDFSDEVVTAADGWPDMKAALAADGVFRLWGCNAVQEYRLAIAEGERNKPKGEDSLFSYVLLMQAYGRVERRLSRKLLHRFLFQRFSDPERSYLAAAAKFFDKPVMGAPPGAGSEFAQRNSIEFMRVDETEWGKTFPYYKEHFGPEFEPTKGPFDTGYVDFHKIAAKSPPPDPAFDPGFYKFTIDFGRKQSAVQFHDLYRVVVAGRDFTLATDKFEAGGKKGYRYVLQNKDKAREQGFFITTAHEAFALALGSDGKFSVVGTQLAPPP